ncbi:3'-5' exonuclease [Streptomyces sp. NPDC048251]|uniref:3'-5' exonuclease n=1 Tax=Streptomyces sp. NPDC048251 TaxID=3154501 RepID=UPI00341E56BB
MPVAFEKQLPATVADIEHLGEMKDVFVRDVDGRRAEFVMPVGTERPTWVVYDGAAYIGIVHIWRGDGQPVWRVQSTGESFRILDDAVRALRRPASWSEDRAQSVRWAANMLADNSLVVISMKTTDFKAALKMQIAAATASGTILLDEDIRFESVDDPASTSRNGTGSVRAATESTLAQILPRLSKVLQGHTLVSYDSESDRRDLERELTRHFGSSDAAAGWLGQAWWEDAIQQYAIWRGLWSHKDQTYLNMPSHDCETAVAGCQSLLAKLKEMTAPPFREPYGSFDSSDVQEPVS